MPIITISIFDNNDNNVRRCKRNLQLNLAKHRVPGSDFDEVMYADDTILISEDTKTMNEFVKQIEIKGKENGLHLNKKKCELLTTEKDPNIHFMDNTKIQKTRWSKIPWSTNKQRRRLQKKTIKKIIECI